MKGLGELFMLGFAGEDLAFLEAWAREEGLGGVILFARNLGAPEAIAALTERLRRLTPDTPPLIAVDQEGGRVARLGQVSGIPDQVESITNALPGVE